MERSKTSTASKGRIVYSTSEGRQKFPDIAQVTFGGKAVIGFNRYGRAICAMTPIEAIKILAEWVDDVDDHTRIQLRDSARALLKQLGEAPEQAKAPKPKPILMDKDEVDARRRAKKAPVKREKKIPAKDAPVRGSGRQAAGR